MPGARYQVLFLFPFKKKKTSTKLFCVWFFFFFFHLSCDEFTRNGFQQLRLPPIGSHQVCFSGRRRLTVQLNPGTFLFIFLLFLIIFLHTSQEAISALALLNLFIQSSVHCMLVNIIDSSSFAVVTLWGIPF